MTAVDIQADGGPYPEDGETAHAYYTRVLSWAATKGYDVQLNEDGYPVFMGYLSGGGNGDEGTVPTFQNNTLTFVLVAVAGAFLLLWNKMKKK
jgi:hypothetical protein